MNQTRPDWYYRYRDDLLQLAPNKMNKVLDVGCGEGDYAIHLKERGATFVAGVEINGEAAAVARKKMDFLWEGSVEGALPFAQGQFDLIICADVLEHLVDPWGVLKNLKTLLAPEGHLLTSIPNLRYAPVLYKLLVRGQFNYISAGVMDYTHLRFFTRSGMKKLIESGGFQIIKWGRPVKPFSYLLSNIITAGIFNDFLTMQYYILARSI